MSENQGAHHHLHDAHAGYQASQNEGTDTLVPIDRRRLMGATHRLRALHIYPDREHAMGGGALKRCYSSLTSTAAALPSTSIQADHIPLWECSLTVLNRAKWPSFRAQYNLPHDLRHHHLSDVPAKALMQAEPEVERFIQ